MRDMRPGIIVIDGTDVAGKSTLSQKLLNKYDGHYIHATYRFKSKMHIYHLAMLRWAIAKSATSRKMVVMDRWWPSEMVYGNVYRQGNRVPNEWLRVLHRLGLRYGVTYVMCYRDSREKLMDAYTESKAKREEMYDADERMMQVHDGFEELFKSIKGQQSRWHRYNVDAAIRNPFYQEEAMKIYVACSTYYNEDRIDLDYRLQHSVGAPHGEYIIVGERINRVARAMDYPWIGFNGVSCSMSKALGELGVPEHHILWSNAYLPDGSPNVQLAAYVKSAGIGRKVIALGNEAKEFCQRAGNCHFSMPHPAYLTRFHGPEALTETLRKVFQ